MLLILLDFNLDILMDIRAISGGLGGILGDLEPIFSILSKIGVFFRKTEKSNFAKFWFGNGLNGLAWGK